MKNLGLFLTLYILSVPALSKEHEQSKTSPSEEQQRQEEASDNLLLRGIPPHNIGTGSGYGYSPTSEKEADKKERHRKKDFK